LARLILLHLKAIDLFQWLQITSQKWIEVVPLKNMMHREVIHFISEHSIHRFSIPQTLTTDRGSSIMSHQVRKFVKSLKIKLLSSSLKYA
jgi:hypothetical protein